MADVPATTASMLRYDIVPLRGVDPVRLGMTRDEVRAVMPADRVSSRRGGGREIDMWHSNAFQVRYDEHDRVEYIELGKGEFTVVLYGVNVFRSKAEALVEHLDQKHRYDREETEGGHSFEFPQPELALWRQALPEPGEPDSGDNGVRFDSVGIGVPGYFSSGG